MKWFEGDISGATASVRKLFLVVTNLDNFLRSVFLALSSLRLVRNVPFFGRIREAASLSRCVDTLANFRPVKFDTILTGFSVYK